MTWWNFVDRSHEEIAQARSEWMTGSRFGGHMATKGPDCPLPDCRTHHGSQGGIHPMELDS